MSEPREWTIYRHATFGMAVHGGVPIEVNEEVRVVESSALDALRAELAEARSGALMNRAVVVCDDLYKLSLERDAITAERDALREALHKVGGWMTNEGHWGPELRIVNAALAASKEPRA